MTKAPTNSAIPPKESRKPRMKSMAWEMPALSLVACSARRSATSHRRGQQRGDLREQRLRGTPGAGRRPGWRRSRSCRARCGPSGCRRPRSSRRRGVDAAEAGEPGDREACARARPPTTPTRSPTAKSWALAVADVDHDLVRARRPGPSARVSGLNRGWAGSTPKPRSAGCPGDDLAVLADELGRVGGAGDVGQGCRRPRRRPDSARISRRSCGRHGRRAAAPSRRRPACRAPPGRCACRSC